MIQALVFDFDGLILDTETPEYDAWCSVYADHGCELPRDAWTGAIGRGREQAAFDPYAVLEVAYGRSLDRDALRLRRRAHYLERVAAQAVRPGVLAYLEEARERGIKLAVASSSDRAWVEGHLDRLGLMPYFQATRCADDVTRTKPDPELYRSALNALGVTEPARAIAFEDSPNGSHAAQQAGLFCVAVPNSMTESLAFPHADLVVASLADLPLPVLLEKATALIPGRDTPFP